MSVSNSLTGSATYLIHTHDAFMKHISLIGYWKADLDIA